MKKINKEQIMGFDVCTVNKDKIIKNIFIDYQKGEQLFIVNINPEIVINNYKNNYIKNIFNKQKYQIPDGIGIVYASKINKGKIKERITGIDLMQDICKESIKHDSKIYLFGSKPGIASKASKELKNKYKRLNIVGCSDGYGDEKTVVENIRKTKADIVFVGLGSPKQEDFIIRNMQTLSNVKIFVPVGGSFDVISNTLKRAPQKMIDLNLEWLYRLLQEPKRIFRQLNLVKFILLIFLNRNGRK